MANKKPTPIVEAEKPGAVKGFFQNIKNFFQGIADKFREIFEYARRRATPREKSVEGQFDSQMNRSFKPSDQLYSEDEKFPGFDEMTLQQGSYVKIPLGTETVWHLRDSTDVAKYLNTIEAKFPDIQDPAATHQGEFITDIARTLEIAAQKKQDITQIYVVGKSLISAEVHDGKISITISDRDRHEVIEPKNTDYLRHDVATLYSNFTAKDSPANIYIDTKSGIRYMQMKNDPHPNLNYKVHHKSHVHQKVIVGNNI